MRVLADLAYLVVLVFFLILLVRLILEWVQYFARDWRPRGIAVVVAEIVYTVTDPPLRALRRVIPPLNILGARVDLAFMVLTLISWLLLGLLASV
ncbi:YggT family protein [Cellulomonas fimi]|uniref:YggT family protein n=1 Tax=Cellulomonas fimi TaxID=1708 RepID=A0A7Y0LZ68_CELFI|nr:YggT family protein [Cellulomonas fimi]NMR20601.1 YggT family protein [Cellulomonas fimi]